MKTWKGPMGPFESIKLINKQAGAFALIPQYVICEIPHCETIAYK